MEEVLEDIKQEFKVDRSDWKPVKFGQVAIQKKESVDREDTDRTWYVKGEHMESEDLHIRQWGQLADEYLGPAFIRKFNKGDILYGSRRTYLRKVAIAHFDGITSNTTFVVNANEKLILKELLPFVMLSEGFAQHSIKNSKGSVNPYINWKDIANYEFLLPPKDQQARLAKLLWAADEVIQNSEQVLESLKVLKHSVRNKVFLGSDVNELNNQTQLPKNWTIKKLSDCAEILNNLRKPISKEEREKIKGSFPYYGPTGIVDFISEYRVDGEFVLIGEDGDHFLKYLDWSMSQFVKGKFNVNNHAHIIRGSDGCSTKWIYFTFQHRNIIPYITRQGASRYKLNKESLSNIPILLPPVNEQNVLSEKFEVIENNLREVEARIEGSKRLQKSLINQNF